MRNIIVAVILAIGAVLVAVAIGNAYKYKFRSNETINVTGGADTNFLSNLIVWTGSYSRKSADLKDAYTQLKTDEGKARDYLTGKGINPQEIVFSSVTINKEFENKFDNNGRVVGAVFTGYNLMQNVKVESSDVDKIEQVSREITELIRSGLEFNSYPPQYYYTKLSDLKISLLAKAAADGRLRAETIAKNAGNALGRLSNASMGIFQIVGENSNEGYTYGGAFNTASKNKTASITVKMAFGVK